MNRRLPTALLAPMTVFLLVVALDTARAGGDIRTERIHFAKGATSTVVEGTISDDSPLAAALLVYSAVVNTLIMNLFLWPVLAWGIVRSGRLERSAGATFSKFA